MTETNPMTTKTKKTSKKSSPKAEQMKLPVNLLEGPGDDTDSRLNVKPKAKVKKVKAATPEAPEADPDTSLTWLPDAPQVTEDSYQIHSWTTSDGRYQVQRCEDTTTKEVVYFGAQYKDGDTWWSCQHHKEGKTYAVHYPTLDRAFEAAELFHCEKTGRAEVASNKADVLAQAHKDGLGGFLPAPTKDKPARKPAEGKASGPKAEGNGTAPRGGQYRLFGFSVTAVLRWMGRQGWKAKEALAVLTALDTEHGCLCNQGTVNIQVRAGAKGERGEPAPLTPTQAEQLEAVRSGVAPGKGKDF
jgi:hypothetical protein